MSSDGGPVAVVADETPGNLTAILAAFGGQGNHQRPGGDTWDGGASSARGTESDFELIGDSPMRPPMQRYVSNDTLLALEAEGESDSDLKRWVRVHAAGPHTSQSMVLYLYKRFLSDMVVRAT
jgi:hypothetical protein